MPTLLSDVPTLNSRLARQQSVRHASSLMPLDYSKFEELAKQEEKEEQERKEAEKRKKKADNEKLNTEKLAIL